MEKLILYDGTSIDIDSGSSEYSFSKTFTSNEDFTETLKRLTETNLSSYSVVNEAGILSATYINKRCKSTSVDVIWDEDEFVNGLFVTFTLEDVNLIEKSIRDLKVSQMAQNSAILELVNMINILLGDEE